MQHIDPEEAKKYLDSIDEQEKVNTITVAQSKNENSPYSKTMSLSGAADSSWKLLDVSLLPSKGMFYPSNCEILIRSAKTSEIRHWSTIDELDPLSVYEKINFILSACSKFKIKDSFHSLTYNDFLEIDKFHILFRIHELTFPNQENKLFANIRCSNQLCEHINRVHVNSQNLIGFSCPEELEKWYSPIERCFVIKSEKIGETLKFYIPTVGTNTIIRKKQQAKDLVVEDDSVYKQIKYFIDDWKNYSPNDIKSLLVESVGWSERKFLIIYKFIESIEKSMLNRLSCTCEKCQHTTETHIFLGGSFTVKDIFIISAGLDELI